RSGTAQQWRRCSCAVAGPCGTGLIRPCRKWRIDPSFPKHRDSRGARNKTGARLLFRTRERNRNPFDGIAVGFREATMTVRAILDSKGQQGKSIRPGENLSAAIKLLGEKRIGAILVLNIGGSIEGILSERDIVRVLAERGAGIMDEPVSAVMTKK